MRGISVIALKPFNVSYASIFYDILTNKEFLKYWGYAPPVSVAEEEKIILEFMSDISRKDFAISYNNKIIGFIGAQALIKNNKEFIRIGYGIDVDYWGKGITSKALSLLLKRIEKKSKKDSKIPKHLIIVAYKRNLGSQKVALKNNFKQIKDLDRIKDYSIKLDNLVFEKYL